MRRTFAALTAAAMLSLAGPAAAATYYDFSQTTPSFASSFDFGEFVATSSATLASANLVSQVSRGPDGLGVASARDDEPGLLDGMPAGITESITLSFSRAVRLDNFTVGLADSDDEYEYAINGGPRIASGLAFNVLNVTGVTRFQIFAVGDRRVDGRLGNDDMTLRAVQTSAVPLPGAIGLLGGAVAALGLIRRRRA